MNDQQFKLLLLTIFFFVLGFSYHLFINDALQTTDCSFYSKGFQPIVSQLGGTKDNLSVMQSNDKNETDAILKLRKENQNESDKVKAEPSYNVTTIVDSSIEGDSNKMIKGLKYSSNTGLDSLNSEYSSRFASLDSKGAWGGNPQLKYFTYLEIILPDFYHVTGIITAGNEDLREWVTEFYIEYWNGYREVWEKYDKVFKGNNDDKTLIVNRLDLKTTKLRIYPVSWEGYPSMRVGLTGQPAKFSICKYYKIKIKREPAQAKYYKELYNKDCGKVPLKRYQEKEKELRFKDTELETLKQKLKEQDTQLQIMNKAKDAELQVLHDQLRRIKKDYCPKDQLVELALKYRDLQLKKNQYD